jgi:hypothetical protein
VPRFEFQPLAEAGGVTSREGRFSLAGVDGATVPGGVLRVWLGPRKVGGRYFRLLVDPGGGVAPWRLAQGLYNDGPYPGQNWAEIFDLDPPAELDLTADWEPGLAPYLRPLAEAVPAGGHLMIEYERPHFRTTQVGLLGGVPPIATPLGLLLHEVGSGDSFKDWYFPEGGQEGGRKLQGNKAYSEEQAQEMAAKRAGELRRYLASPARGEVRIEARARRDAAALLEALPG